ncbi:hypothetical protein BB561_002319 [Smittium simulii]|uniref:JmjC domain-containing protein n=1 Tax=Smittium simulii TaxID=133385 RepID=A0A2T9YQT4_9FUNG|nr:hypothetical protein BB561_002319 [Smittium simulii]
MSDCQPFIIENAISFWPAFSEPSSWKNPTYLISAVGKHRLVPVEVGSKYTDPNWTQKLVPFGQYIDSIQSGDESTYLAQYNLFKHSSSLQSDFIIPDYCFVDAACLDSQKYLNPQIDTVKQCCGNTTLSTNIWLGPANSVSPLHYDDFHNLFAQVVGYKYVKLISNKYSDKVYPYPGSCMLSNTSMVDAEYPNFIQFPDFKHIEFVDCIVGPGDLLYIPPRFWHYLRATTTSISISNWF